MLAEQLPGVDALSVKLRGPFALAIWVSVDSLSAFNFLHGHRQGYGLLHLRVRPAARVVARRGLDPLGVVGCPVEGRVLV